MKKQKNKKAMLGKKRKKKGKKGKEATCPAQKKREKIYMKWIWAFLSIK